MMENLLRNNWIRRSGTFCAGVALTVAALFSGSTSTMAAGTRATASYQPQDDNNLAEKFQPRKIEIDLSQQRLYAWKGDKLVYSMRVSTGKRSTPTRTGTYSIGTKLRSTRMRGRDYNVPNVPYTMYYNGGYAIHGAYWHERFGTAVSHGCVNLPVKQAKKLYKWASVGTEVEVHK